MSSLAILLVEDDKDISKLLKYNLEKDGYRVSQAFNGEEGVALFRRDHPRMVILDLMLPKVEGLEVCRLIRAEDRRVPILIVSAKSTEVDKVVGLEMGADDYVIKPFSMREVLSRVRALLRRSSGEEHTTQSLRVGAVEMDPQKFELRLAGHPLEVTHKEFELLKHLWMANGKVLSREDLLERIWGIDKASDIDTRTVDQHIARLRAKLGSESRRITTVKNMGYKFKI